MTDLKDILDYSPSTGELTWKTRKGVSSTTNTQRAGKKAGTTSRHGWRYIVIDGKTLKAENLIWELVTGEPPEYKVQFKDKNPRNLQFSNLYLEKRRVYREETISYNPESGKYTYTFHRDDRTYQGVYSNYKVVQRVARRHNRTAEREQVV